MSSEPVLKLDSIVEGKSQIVFDQGDLDKLAEVLAPLVADLLGEGGDPLGPRMDALEAAAGTHMTKGEVVDIVTARIRRALAGKDVEDPKPKGR